MLLFQSSLSKTILEEMARRKPEIKINVLRTFSDSESDNWDYAQNRTSNLNKLILDSGTFTMNNAQKPGKHVKKENYGKFLKDYGELFDWCFNFDEIHRSECTTKNFANMKYYERQNLNVIPVIQDFKEINYFIDNKEKYPLLAIGSTLNKDLDEVKSWIRVLYEENIKVHMFAAAAYNKLFDVPVYSSDSKSYLDYSNFKRACYFDDAENKEVHLYIGTRPHDAEGFILYPDNPYYSEYSHWLRINLDMSVHDLHVGKNLLIANCYYFWWLEQKITQVHHENKVFEKST